MPTSVGIRAEGDEMYDTDVLIVGAGPSGLTLAASLVKRGVATTVVDRQAAGANTSRAAVVNARTLEVLEDLDVARRLVKEGIQAPRFTIRDRAPHAHPDRLQRAADRLPVLADGSPVDHREAAARSADRTRRHGHPAQDADLDRAGRRRRDGHVRRRRCHPGPLRRRRRRHPQHRARAGGHRLRGRRVRASRSSWPTSGWAAKHPSTR